MVSCKLILFVVIFLVVLLLQFQITSKSVNVSFTGGKKENIWDKKCLKKNSDLDDLLSKYKKKTVGNKLRSFLKWYKSSLTASAIIKHLLCEGFKIYPTRLQTDGYYINSIGKKTSTTILGVPHFIFIHEDHSCLRLKPVIGGLQHSHTPFPTISFSIVYDPESLSFQNEAFKVTREGEPVPKAGLRHPEACLNPKLLNFQFDEIMKSTHLKLPKPSIEDIQFFRKFKFDH